MYDAVSSMRAPRRRDVEAAVERLRHLHDGEAAMLAAVAIGQTACAPLAALLREREPSGIFQPRCLAAQALGLLHADALLIDFLRHPRFPDSPIELAGEEAAVNAAARALGRHRPAAALDLLTEIGRARPHLDGVIEALAGYARAGTIPALVAALAEDASRAAAQRGLRAIGKPAQRPLLAIARDGEPDTETHRRQRRAALDVLLDIGVPPHSGPALEALIRDAGPSIAAVACGVALRFGPAALATEAGERLASLDRHAQFGLAIEIAGIRRRIVRAGP